MATQEKELTAEDRLSKLYELQLVDSKIDELTALWGELPREVDDLKDEVAGLTARLEKIEGDIKELETKISECKIREENAIKLCKKYEAQLNAARNDRDADSLQRQIDYQKTESEICQKNKKRFTEELEKRKADKINAMETKEQKQIDLNEKAEELKTAQDDTKAQKEALQLRSQKLEASFPKDPKSVRLLTAFKRIRQNATNGLAIVTIERDACSGCNSRIPAQRQLDTRMRKKEITCEYCGRILIDPELAEAVRKKAKL